MCWLLQYDVPENVELLDLGCLSLAMIDRVREFDVILTVDAVDDSGEPAGTILRYAPDAMARHVGITASLHDLKLIDLFDSRRAVRLSSRRPVLRHASGERVTSRSHRRPHARCA